jgi:enoyl-CoA hydratase
MAGSCLLSEREDGIVVLTLNDPERRNAMTRAMGEEIAARVADLARDPGLRAAVLTGAGRAFSAGGDMAMLEERARKGEQPAAGSRAATRDAMREFYGLFLRVRELPFPIVAALNGHAIGAGLCVALACDLRVASREARLGLNFARLGVHPGMGATWTLPRLVGPAHAADLLFTGRLLSGEEAARIGLVNAAVAPEQVLPEALALARAVAANAPGVVRAAKRALARSASASLEDQLDFEAERQAESFETADVREGLAALRERRDPRFEGR